MNINKNTFLIARKGGPTIQRECNEKGPINLGKAVLTTGGDLKASYVIHAASMNLGGKTSVASLRSSIKSTLQLTEQNNIKSIAFPAIGTGIAGFPLDKCAEIMFEEFKAFLEKGNKNLKEIQVILYTKDDFKTFKKIFDEIFNKKDK